MPKRNFSISKMNSKERILALDAALVACEGIEACDEVLNCINNLQSAMEKFCLKEYDNEPFGKFLEEQYRSVIKLSNNPQVFGYVGNKGWD